MSDERIITRPDDFKRQFEDGYCLTTAEILYRMPDYPRLLQSFIWQDLDRIPGFPVLRGFLTFWQKECEGKLYRVRVATIAQITPAGWNGIGEIPIN